MLVLAVTAACSDSSPLLSKVFKAPPWQGSEQLRYTLVDEGGQAYGACVLETKPEAEPGRTQINHLCGGTGPERDDRTAVLDAATLRPVSASRTISDPTGNKRTTFTSEYDPAAATVHFKIDENGKVRETNRDLPKGTKQSPDPGYYDDESLFWLMRGVPLEKGFEGAYADVNASTGQVITASVHVEDRESVKAPAGTFQAWRLRLETSSITQYFWIDDAAPHAVVKARIERVTYLLAAAP
jgi:Protein of unknown function (DUF3108)